MNLNDQFLYSMDFINLDFLVEYFQCIEKDIVYNYCFTAVHLTMMY